MYILQATTRERCPRISKEEEKQIIQLLQRKTPIEVKKRNPTELKLYKKISKYNMRAGEIYDPTIDSTVTGLTIDDRNVLYHEEIVRCISRYYKKN